MNTTKHEAFGVLYFHDDNPSYKEMAQLSIASLRRHHPDWPLKVVEVTSMPVPAWKKAYRAVSFWKWKKRRNRAGQDVRIIAKKAQVMVDSPFTHTLYLDTDTIVLRPLDGLRERILSADVVITPLPWKRYTRIADHEPESWPFMMAGVMGYSRRFIEKYASYVHEYEEKIAELPSQEQFLISLCCEVEKETLSIVEYPSMQIDALNLAQHLGTERFPCLQPGVIDLSWNRIQEFLIFHYNEHKPPYMAQARRLWEHLRAPHG